MPPHNELNDRFRAYKKNAQRLRVARTTILVAAFVGLSAIALNAFPGPRELTRSAVTRLGTNPLSEIIANAAALVQSRFDAAHIEITRTEAVAAANSASVADAIGSWFSHLFGTPAPSNITYDRTPQQPTSLEPPPPAPITYAPAPATTTIIRQYITQPVQTRIERVVEKQIPAAFTGPTFSDLAALRTELLANIAQSIPAQPAFVPPQVAAGGTTVIYQGSAPAAQRIDNLDGVTIRNATIIGGSISGTSGVGGGGIGSDATTTTFFSTVGHFTMGIIDALSSAAATIANLTSTELVATNATTTNFAATNASTTNLTTGSLTLGSGTGLLYANGGAVSATANGADGKVLKLSGGVPTWGTDISGSGGGSSAWATTTDNLALYPADTSQVALVGASATSTTGNILEVKGNTLLRGTATAYNTITAPTFTATSTTASQLPYASTTAISATSASTTNLIISGSPGGLLKTSASGLVTLATAGVDYLNSTSGDWTGTLGGLSASQLLASSFSTTSADVWKSNRNFFSTTSADYYASATNLFSTTSADYLASQRNYFSTTSADFFVTQRNFFSTTSSDYWKSLTDLFSTTSSNYLLGTYDKGFFFSTTSADAFAAQRNFFSTTSADAFVAQRNFFSTTSTDFWKSGTSFFSTSSTDFWKFSTNFFATTSSDFWKTQNDFFSTTSASYFLTQNTGAAFSTTSAIYFTDASTSIAKTYANNVFAGIQTFANASTTNFSSSYASTTQLFGANLVTCNGGNVLTWANGQFGCAADQTGGSSAFSTTSTDYWSTQRNFFSTTSAQYLFTLTNFFSTTSTDYWKTQNDFFSTTSATYFSDASTSIAKTYTSNTFTGTQTFTNASTTNISSSYASSTAGFFGSVSIGSLTGFLKATAGAITSALINLASEVTGILPVGNGGTGWASLAAGAIPYGNGASAVATTTTGLPGQVLALLNGVPTWTSTTTFSSGLNYSAGNVTLDTTGNWSGTLGNYTAAQLLASSFSTTSADYLATQRNYFSTTSATYFADASTTVPKTYSSNTFTGSNIFNGTLTFGSLNGPLQSNAGVVSATTSIGILYGGTGTTTGGVTNGVEYYNGTTLTNGSGLTFTGTNLGIATSTPWRLLSMSGAVSTAQQTIAYDSTRWTDFLTNSVGDFYVYPSNKNFLVNNGNAWICSGGSGGTNACPAGSPATQGNLIAATAIGVATSTPNNMLDVFSATKAAIGFSGASGETYKWTVGEDVSNAGRFAISSSTALGTNDRFVIDGAGNVGIASSTPYAKFSVGAGAILTTENLLTDGATIAVDWSQGNQQRVTLGGNRAITFSNNYTGQILRLLLCQDGTGSRTITSWPSSVLWSGGTAPTLTTTANKCDVLSFIDTSATGTAKVLGASTLNF